MIDFSMTISMTLKKVSKPLTLHLLKNKTCKTTDFFVILEEDNKKKKVGLIHEP